MRPGGALWRTRVGERDVGGIDGGAARVQHQQVRGRGRIRPRGRRAGELGGGRGEIVRWLHDGGLRAHPIVLEPVRDPATGVVRRERQTGACGGQRVAGMVHHRNVAPVGSQACARGAHGPSTVTDTPPSAVAAVGDALLTDWAHPLEIPSASRANTTSAAFRSSNAPRRGSGGMRSRARRLDPFPLATTTLRSRPRQNSVMLNGTSLKEP